MVGLPTPQKTDRGWIIEMPVEMTQALGVEQGSFAVLYSNEGQIGVEVLPPIPPDLEASVIETCEEFNEAFEEMKRRGD